MGLAQVPPLLTLPHCYCLSVVRGGAVFLAACGAECAPLGVVEFLGRLADVCAGYFGPALEETAVRNGLTTLHLLLEEAVDCGQPFTAESNVLREMVRPPNALSRAVQAVTGASKVSERLPPGAISGTPWRRTNAKYGNNELAVEVREEVDCTVSVEGRVESCMVYGELIGNSRLSGPQPLCTVTLRNPAVLGPCRLHPAVDAGRWDAGRALVFVPPDGPFKLMSYSARGPDGAAGWGSGGSPVPLYVMPQVTFEGLRGRLSVMVGLKPGPGKRPEGVVVRVPLPEGTRQADVAANHGHVGTHLHEGEVVWTIGRIPLDKPPCLTGSFTRAPEEGGGKEGATEAGGGAAGAGEAGAGGAEGRRRAPMESPTLGVAFHVPGAAASGLAVESVRIDNVDYKAQARVSCSTHAGYFQVRA